MAETGVLADDDRVELVGGEIIEMSPIGKRHAACVDRLTRLLSKLGDQLIVRVQGPIQVDQYSEFQPDFALLRSRNDFYASSLPLPNDILLVIEVADSTVEYDRLMKVPAYARAGIPESWLVDLPADRIELNAFPVNEQYSVTRSVSRGEGIESETIHDLKLFVDEIIGE